MSRYDMVRFERGQVWMIRSKKQESVGREQDKDRPWLVLSIGKFNHSSGMITCVPMTSRDATRTPAQVLMTNTYGKPNVIACEQIRSFDTKSGNYIFDFMGNVSNEILEQVDVSISIHLGMHYSPITLNKLYDSMEAIIKSVGHMQAKADTPKFTDDDVLNFAEKLQLLASNPANNEVSATISIPVTKPTSMIIKDPEPKSNKYVSSIDTEFRNTDPDPGYEVDPTYYYKHTSNDSNGKIDDIKTTSTEIVEDETPKQTKLRKWTKEKCEEFLHDAETLPVKDVMEKWNILKKPRYFVMRNYVAGKLREMTK